MIAMSVELCALPSEADRLEGILHALAASTRHEPGNLIYGVHRCQDARNRFLVYELYIDESACAHHLATGAVQSALHTFESVLQVTPRILRATWSNGSVRPDVVSTLASARIGQHDAFEATQLQPLS